MTLWAAVILVIALIFAIANLIQMFPFDQLDKQEIIQNIILFLVALGVLMRIRFKTQEGEKEKLEQKVKAAKTRKRTTATGARTTKRKTSTKKKSAKKKTPVRKTTVKKKAPVNKKTAKKKSPPKKKTK